MNTVLNSVPTTIPGFMNGAGSPNFPNGPGPFPSQGGASGFSSSSSSGFGLAPILGVLAEVLAIFAVLAIVGVFVIIVVANRADPDPSGRRPQSVYYFAVSFVTIGISIIGSAAVVAALVEIVGSHPSSITNSVARTVVLGGLVTLISVALLITHLRRGLVLARDDAELPNPSRRVGQSYVAAVAFLSVMALLVMTVLSVYLIFVIAGPGVFGSFGGRGTATRFLVEAVYIAAVAGVVLWTHRNLVPPGLPIFRSAPGPDDPGPAPSTTGGPPPDMTP